MRRPTSAATYAPKLRFRRQIRQFSRHWLAPFSHLSSTQFNPISTVEANELTHLDRPITKNATGLRHPSVGSRRDRRVVAVTLRWGSVMEIRGKKWGKCKR
jgi:hypothetical protein